MRGLDRGNLTPVAFRLQGHYGRDGSSRWSLIRYNCHRTAIYLMAGRGHELVAVESNFQSLRDQCMKHWTTSSRAEIHKRHSWLVRRAFIHGAPLWVLNLLTRVFR